VSDQIEFVQLDLKTHKSQLLDLNVEYMDWAAKQILENFNIDISIGGEISLRDYLSESIDNLGADVPPSGIYYLVQFQNELIGMGCVHRLKDDIAEIKRMYIRPEYRGKGSGKALLQKLITLAKEYGYHSIYLDSGSFMKDAHRLYRSLGFVDRAPYIESEIPPELTPYWVFMEKSL
jgi:GNAT superfamily N-acetyltransferase